MPAPDASGNLPLDCIPAAVRALLDALAAEGFPSVLVGGCVRDLLEGRPVHDFDVATPAPPERVLRRFPRAVPIGLRHGTVMVPTPAGPVDVTTFRHGPRLEDDLARRDFTVNALALDAATGRILDPHDGLADLRAGRLRAVGSAEERLSEDPLRALRALRLLAERGLEPDPELRAALPRAVARLPAVAGERLRSELERILLGPHAGRALRLLRETGLEAALAPGLPPHAAQRVPALPCRRDDRLAGWLLGTDPHPVLARLRFSRSVADRIARILRAHPIHEGVDPDRPGALRRLLQRHDADDRALLFALAEIADAYGRPAEASARARVAALRQAVARIGDEHVLALHREDLALDGEAVMAVLGCGPGPVVGAALRYLTECVLDDPHSNHPETLRARLEAWAAAQRCGAP